MQEKKFVSSIAYSVKNFVIHNLLIHISVVKDLRTPILFHFSENKAHKKNYKNVLACKLWASH